MIKVHYNTHCVLSTIKTSKNLRIDFCVTWGPDIVISLYDNTFCSNYALHWAAFVALWEEWFLPIPEVRGSNFILPIYIFTANIFEKMKIKAGNGYFKIIKHIILCTCQSNKRNE